jgi:bacillithiol system protein YtxJ
MTNYQLITDPQAVDEMLSPGAGPVLLFKHSLTCPISFGAFREFERFLAGKLPNGLKIGLIHVQTARPASSRVAELSGIRHESPQALLFDGGEVRWHRSHGQITARSLEDAVALQGASP